MLVRLDALLNGSYEDVPESIKGIKLQRFFSRTHSEKISRSSPRILENSIQNMTSKVVFGFHSGYEEVTTGLPRSRTSRNAITRNHTIFDRIEVLVSTEMAQPLLRDDLTDAEKWVAWIPSMRPSINIYIQDGKPFENCNYSGS